MACCGGDNAGGGSILSYEYVPGQLRTSLAATKLPSFLKRSTNTFGFLKYGGSPGSAPSVNPPIETMRPKVLPHVLRLTKKPALFPFAPYI